LSNYIVYLLENAEYGIASMAGGKFPKLLIIFL